MSLTHPRMSTIITIAVVFLLVGTFTSVTVQGGFQVLFAIPLAFYFWRALGRDFQLPASSWWMLAFAAVALASVLVNWSDIPRPTKNLGKVKYFIYAAIGIFPIGVWLKRVSDNTKSRLVILFSLVVFALGLYCAYQVVITGRWKARPLTETMRYSYGSALVLVIWLSLFFQKEKFKSWLSTPWSILGIAGLVMSVLFVQARGAQGALLLSVPFILFYWNRKIGMVALLLGAIGMGYLTYNYFFQERLAAPIKILKTSQNSSDQTRRSQWLAAIKAIEERPILGWGHGNFHTQVERIKNQYDLPRKEYKNNHSHNVLLEVAAGTGLIGVILFIIAFCTWVWECWRAGGVIRAVMMPFFVAVVFEAQFEVILDANNATWIGFLYAVSLAAQKRYQLVFA
jgi:O-antigen ligase